MTISPPSTGSSGCGGSPDRSGIAPDRTTVPGPARTTVSAPAPRSGWQSTQRQWVSILVFFSNLAGAWRATYLQIDRQLLEDVQLRQLGVLRQVGQAAGLERGRIEPVRDAVQTDDGVAVDRGHERLLADRLQIVDRVAVGEQHQLAELVDPDGPVDRRPVQVQQQPAEDHRRGVVDDNLAAERRPGWIQ